MIRVEIEKEFRNRLQEKCQYKKHVRKTYLDKIRDPSTNTYEVFAHDKIKREKWVKRPIDVAVCK